MKLKKMQQQTFVIITDISSLIMKEIYKSVAICTGTGENKPTFEVFAHHRSVIDGCEFLLKELGTAVNHNVDMSVGFNWFNVTNYDKTPIQKQSEKVIKQFSDSVENYNNSATNEENTMVAQNVLKMVDKVIKDKTIQS